MQNTWKRFVAVIGVMAIALLSLGAGAALAHPWTLLKKAAATENGAPISAITAPFGVLTTIYYKVTIVVDALDDGDCIQVTDTMNGSTPVVLAACLTTGTYDFPYTFDITPRSCGSFDLVNTVKAQYVPGLPTDSEEVPVTVTVTVPQDGCTPPPPLGCTLTQGYWKTHSEFGPAPYDATWALLPNGASANFFLSGSSYIGALNTPPGGNAYWQLAHQYIAAQLNALNGAAGGAITSQFAQATGLLAAYTPTQVGAMRGSSAVLAQFRALAGVLDSYNNGLIGPGHCN